MYSADVSGATFPGIPKYSIDLIDKVAEMYQTMGRGEIAEKLGMKLQQGVYIGCTGPSYETPAEIRAFRIMGADTVGMSTVQEVIAANHCGIDVLGFSLVSNKAAGLSGERLTEEEVLTIGRQKSEEMQTLITEIVGEF